jgi:CheY-like chemotaxis protein
MVCILIVEPDESEYRALAHELTLAGYDSRHAETGIDSLGFLWGGNCFDLVACSTSLPDLDPYAILQAVREYHECMGPIPFFLMTDLRFRIDGMTFTSVPPAGYWQKPLNYLHVLSDIAAALESQPPHRAIA